MPKDGVDWKAEEEYLKEIGFQGQPVTESAADIVGSFKSSLGELAVKVRARLVAAGYPNAVVRVTGAEVVLNEEKASEGTLVTTKKSEFPTVEALALFGLLLWVEVVCLIFFVEGVVSGKPSHIVWSAGVAFGVAVVGWTLRTLAAKD